MKIEVKSDYLVTELIIVAQNVKIHEDIEQRVFGKSANGNVSVLSKDIKTDVLQQITNVLQTMIELRTAEFDSSALIVSLFEKLPKDVAKELVVYLQMEVE